MKKVEDFVLEQNILNIPVIARGGEKDNGWEEKTVIISVSQNSRGIILSRKLQIGQLISLNKPDESPSDSVFEKSELIWGIIQTCTLVSGNDSTDKYHIGIALVGENPPESYFANSEQFYAIIGINEDGFWKIKETGKLFISRKHPRFLISFEVYLGMLDDSFNLGGGEKVLTENISFGGAAVFSHLELQVGDCVKFISARHEFSALAVVRNLTKISDKKHKIHLEFVAARFPVEKVTFHQETSKFKSKAK